MRPEPKVDLPLDHGHSRVDLPVCGCGVDNSNNQEKRVDFPGWFLGLPVGNGGPSCTPQWTSRTKDWTSRSPLIRKQEMHESREQKDKSRSCGSVEFAEKLNQKPKQEQQQNFPNEGGLTNPIG